MSFVLKNHTNLIILKKLLSKKYHFSMLKAWQSTINDNIIQILLIKQQYEEIIT